MERGAVPAGGAEQARSVLQPESPAAVPALTVALCSPRGADIDVAAEHELSKSFVFPGANEIVELAAGRARRAAQIIEPGLWPLDKATNDDETDPPRVTTLSRTDPRAPKGKGVPKSALDRGHESIFFLIKRTDTTAR